MKFPLLKDAAHLEYLCISRHVFPQDILCFCELCFAARKFAERQWELFRFTCFPCSFLQLHCCVMMVHLPRGIHRLLPPRTALPRPLMRPPASCLYCEGCIPIERQEWGDRLKLGDLWSLSWPKPSNAPLTETNNGYDQHLQFSPCKLQMIYGWRL